MYNKLSEMAMETLNTLFEDSTEKNAIKWTATFQKNRPQKHLQKRFTKFFHSI